MEVDATGTVIVVVIKSMSLIVTSARYQAHLTLLNYAHASSSVRVQTSVSYRGTFNTIVA